MLFRTNRAGPTWGHTWQAHDHSRAVGTRISPRARPWGGWMPPPSSLPQGSLGHRCGWTAWTGGLISEWGQSAQSWDWDWRHAVTISDMAVVSGNRRNPPRPDPQLQEILLCKHLSGAGRQTTPVPPCPPDACSNFGRRVSDFDTTLLPWIHHKRRARPRARRAPTSRRSWDIFRTTTHEKAQAT